MEEVVRAFHWVIEQGLVCSPAFYNIYLTLLCIRHIIGRPQSGLLLRSRRHSVSSEPIVVEPLTYGAIGIAEKYNLHAPIADECQHK